MPPKRDDDARRQDAAAPRRAPEDQASGTFTRQEPWRELQEKLGKAHDHPELEGTRVGEGKTDYEVYVRTRELLALQPEPDELVHPDELLFQVTHQSQELWMKLAAHEAVRFVRALDEDAFERATAAAERIGRAFRAMTADMNVLQTLTPASFQVIRRSLGNGSGLQSPGFLALRHVAEALTAALRRAFLRRQIELRQLYEDESLDPALFAMCERLLDLDELFQLWLVTHFMLVRRTIGVDRTVQALDGYPTKALEVRMKKPLFPDLWDVRVRMTRDWDRDGGIAPGAPRPKT
ncbi:MAG: tryptophan 2,3-dioxygenase [Sandaracinus sp.]|nr:tryptophan 2,3-dioxygenase [Myxococcales bacterium]MCB9604193.1 tryptophan 2,3-dioxygenase [Sandaracinus sp.]MCB9616862.1 tryptophan 2,3-dioxygenase [Sandaracinus sp.]MCB9634556.1 tryptophan 2,3-dioxygenase [Sandaracinus sp.]